MAAAPWIKIFMPLLIGATASSGEKVLDLQSATMLMTHIPFCEKDLTQVLTCTNQFI
ncbi:MAG: hypothetical protein ABIJ37_07880 [Pseudomonadota bacterium]